MWRDDAYVLDMVLAARKVLAHSKGVTWERFQCDEVLQNALMHLLQIIGEAARKVSGEFKIAHPEVPWADIVGLRHRLVHEYFRIIPEKVWEAVERDVPGLVSILEPLVPPPDDADS
jgi:uncharacterized protein with HEPN domain